MTGAPASGGWRLASPATALILGAAILVLMAAEPPLASLAHQSLLSSGGSVPLPYSVIFAAVGFVVAWRKPGNPLGWLILGAAGFFALSEDASFYAVADYRLHHGSLPLGWLALITQPGWAPGIASVGLIVLLFPDGRPLNTVVVGAVALHRTCPALDSRRPRLYRSCDPGGPYSGRRKREPPGPRTTDRRGRLVGSGPERLLLRARRERACLAGRAGDELPQVVGGASPAAEVAAGRAAGGLAGLLLTLLGSSPGGWGVVIQILGAAGLFALPVCIGIGILRYRLFDIDRILSRTLAYALLTGLLVGVYAGLVLLATRVLAFVLAVGGGRVHAGRRSPVHPAAAAGAADRGPPVQPGPL